jgi:hypothetical protein
VDVRIGVTNSMRELELEYPDSVDRDALKAEISGQLANGSGVLWLTDKKGRDVAVPVEKVAYVEIGHPAQQRAIGFSA